MHALALFEIGYQQIEHMVRSAQQSQLRAFGFERAARVAHVLIAQPVGQQHDHAGGRGLDFARIDAHGARAAHAVEHGLHRAGLVLQHPLEMRFEPAVFRQQVVQVAVQEAVLPDQLEQRVHEEPGILDIAHASLALSSSLRTAHSGRTAS